MKQVRFKLQGSQPLNEGLLDLQKQEMTFNRQTLSLDHLKFDNPISGTLYGTLLNYEGEYELLKPEMNDKPYQKPPQAPVLYIKPMNTFSAHGNPIPLPEGEERIQVGAALGLVIGKTATKVKANQAYDYISGYTIVNDVSLPFTNVHRPAIKQKSRDGFCPIGPWIVDREEVIDPHQLSIKVWVNGQLKQENHTGHLIRKIPELIEDVTEFMTLYEGDVLLVGVPENQPFAQAGDEICVEIEQIGRLKNEVVKESEVYRSGVSLNEARTHRL